MGQFLFFFLIEKAFYILIRNPGRRGWKVPVGSNLRKQIELIGEHEGFGCIFSTESSDLIEQWTAPCWKAFALKMGESSLEGMEYTGDAFSLKPTNAVFATMVHCGTFADLHILGAGMYIFKYSLFQCSNK